MGNITAFAENFTELLDTPSSFAGAANEFVRVNGTPDALVFFDLFGTANVWTANQTINADLNMGGNVLPTTNNTRDLGSDALSFAEVWSRQGIFVEQSGVGAITFDAADGGIIAGRAVGGSGTSELIKSGNYPPPALIGNALTAGAGHTASLELLAGGGTMIGSAFTSGSGTKVAQLFAGNYAYGSFTGGYAFAYGGGGAYARIQNLAAGSFLWAYAAKSGAGTHLATTASGAAGAFAVGRLQGGGSHTLRASSGGSFAQGILAGSGSGIIEVTAAGPGGFSQGRSNNGGIIRTTGDGGFAQGNVNGAGTILAGGNGSLAHGHVTTGTIQATAAGALAVGSATTGTIEATAENAGQFGVGSNSLADSFQFGNGGLRMKGTTGAPGTPQNGDIWVASGFVYIRSNGVSVQIT